MQTINKSQRELLKCHSPLKHLASVVVWIPPLALVEGALFRSLNQPSIDYDGLVPRDNGGLLERIEVVTRIDRGGGHGGSDFRRHYEHVQD
jgi:hypothetical protein